jgi:hypothetical protein
MTVDEIMEMSLEQLQNKMLEVFAQEGVAMTYLTIEEQQIESANYFAEMTIKPGTKEFDQYMSWAEKSLKIEATQQHRLDSLDESHLRRARDKRNEARKGAVEYFIKNQKELKAQMKEEE